MSHDTTGAEKSPALSGEIERPEHAGGEADADRATDRAFASIYPDVNPAQALGTTTGERVGLAVATGVLAFGGAMGDLIIAGVGLALVLFFVIAASMKVRRRVRNEARSRFPHQDWAENKANNTYWMMGCWAIIIAIVAVALFFVPENQKMIGAAAAAAIAAALMWLCPGIAPARKRRKKHAETKEEIAADEDDFWSTEESGAWVGTKTQDDDTQYLESVVSPDKPASK
ncbi:hypothetical protein ACG98H_09805 [Corynebacterium sp. L4756]|uniref:hypothetical protein n=1 Tax=unclassified Corynebacterium TaxID=2624378 RepID=UPI00374D9FC1